MYIDNSAEFTCVAPGHPASFPVLKAMWAQCENEVTVVRKGPEPKVNQVTELIHCFDVRICSTEIRRPAKG